MTNIDEKKDESGESGNGVKRAFRAAVASALDARLQKVLDGEEGWPALQQYVDGRIEAYLAQRDTEG